MDTLLISDLANDVLVMMSVFGYGGSPVLLCQISHCLCLAIAALMHGHVWSVIYCCLSS